MNKAVPWNINGVGFNAREAAREAARRQGKSLGEWLHGVIADHAAELGVEARDIADQDRIDAVTDRLERLSGRSAEPGKTQRDRADSAPRLRSNRAIDDVDDMPPMRRSTQRRDPDAALEARRARRAPSIDETEFLLEDAIDAMERRAARTERRTDLALADFAKMLESTESRRDRERDAVRELSQKLTDIEAKLTVRSDDDTPVKSALARLEARLEAISRRSTSESAVRLQVGRPLAERRADAEPIRRLEDKLNSILEAVASKPQATPTAGQPISHRRLGDAIAEISRRQKSLDGSSGLSVPTPSEGRRMRPILVRDLPHDDAPWQRSLSAMQDEIASLATKIEDMRRDAAAPRTIQEPVDLEGLRSEIGAMSHSLRELAPRGTVAPLQDSIDSLLEQIEISRVQGVRDTALQPIEAAIGNLREKLPEIDPRPKLGLIEREVQTIAEKVDSLSSVHAPDLLRLQSQMEEIRDLVAKTATRPLAVEHMERQISALSDRFEELSSRPSAGRDLGTAAADIRAMTEDLPGATALGKIESRLEALAQKLDEAIETGPETQQDVASLERLVRELAQKIEAAQAPGADSRVMDALQRQVESLAARLEQSESGGTSLANLERSIRDLFAHLEQTRASVEASAANAAREALRGAGAPDAAALKTLQTDADRRTQSTLNAVHQTLEHIVGRMSAMEADLAKVRQAPVADALSSRPSPGRSARSPSLDMSLGGIDSLADPLFAQKPADGAKKASPAATRPKAPSPDDDAGRADFIAAARRAAKTAQTDPSVVAIKQESPPSDLRAGLLAKSKDYVATHKRPVLLGIAAVFVVLGTMAVVQRMTFDVGDPQMAVVAPPAKIARMADVSAPAPNKPATVSAMQGDLTPSALPRGTRALAAQIPGSDPVQTSSIQSLPSFAAQGAAHSAAPRPTIPAGLIAMADSGDGAAEYELATQYADGKIVPRDFKLAANWYTKAAAQGLAPAQYRLAALYEKGLGVPQDKTKARSLYQRAADAGNPRAMHNLAVLLADGDGKPDYAGAATWFRKAAQYGVHDSQYNLAILLARGLGVDQSLVQSYQWFAVAANQNDADAAKKRDEVGDKLSANDLAVAKALVASFQPRTANVAATEVPPPPGGWDSVGGASPINSARSKISSL